VVTTYVNGGRYDNSDRGDGEKEERGGESKGGGSGTQTCELPPFFVCFCFLLYKGGEAPI